MRYAYVLIFFLLCVGAASADGCFLPPATYFNDLYEPQQKAAIMHENGRETLILQVSYDGEPTDFGWIIPAPSPATVTEADADIFASLHYLTKAKYRSADFGGMMSFGAMKAAGIMGDGVEILNQQQIGVFEVTTLKATDAAALDSWLAQNGYRLPEGTTEVLSYYVAKNWTYTALRIDLLGAQDELLKEAQRLNNRTVAIDDLQTALVELYLSHARKGTAYENLPLLDYEIEDPLPLGRILTEQEYNRAKRWSNETESMAREIIAEPIKRYVDEMVLYLEIALEQGDLTALRLDFATPEPVYPLYISSMNAGETEVLLYLISQHKTLVEQEGFTLEYAGMVPESYLEEDEYYDNNQEFKELLREGEGRYITKHRAKMNASAMESDLTFLQAPNDKEERITIYADGFWLTRSIQALIPILIYGLLFWRLNKVRARRNQERTDLPPVNLGKHALLTLLMILIGSIALLMSSSILTFIVLPIMITGIYWLILPWIFIVAAAALFFDFLLIRLIYSRIIGTRGKARKEVQQWAR